MLRPPPSSTLFPYTTLFRSLRLRPQRGERLLHVEYLPHTLRLLSHPQSRLMIREIGATGRPRNGPGRADLSDHQARLRIDRKSTRLNSSHSSISYAVFCLKK